MSDDLKSVIEAAWEARADINTGTQGAVREAVEETLSQLDAGTLRVATRGDDGVWTTHQWAKQAILLSFRLNPNMLMDAPAPGPSGTRSPRSSPAGTPPGSRPPASAPCPASWLAAAPSSPATPC